MFGWLSRSALKVACVTTSERGVVRKDNQDSFFVDAAKTVFCVADGMGGGAEGATASRFVRRICLCAAIVILVVAIVLVFSL